MSTPTHWDAAYSAGHTTRGWYQPVAATSMRMLAAAGAPLDASVVDIGAGASVFADDLIEAGFIDITLLDHSPVGLAVTRERLGEKAAGVEFVAADLLQWRPTRTFDVWHDRAVLHFLLDDTDVLRYRDTLLAATTLGSIAIIGVFGPEGPQMCAGLPVRRYDDLAITRLLGEEFEILSSETGEHIRPDGDTQQYLWTLARRMA